MQFLGHEVAWQVCAQGVFSGLEGPAVPPAHCGPFLSPLSHSWYCHWSLCLVFTHAISWVPGLFQSSVWLFFFFP